jgi:hypothetical protein
LIAIADQGRAIVGLGSLDGATQTLPALYSLYDLTNPPNPAIPSNAQASDFRDIQTGNNGFAAGIGYDLVTGLGSPVADVLVPDLAFGTSFVVTNTNNGGNGSLRQAIEEADHSAKAAVISFNISSKFPDFKDGIITLRPSSQLPLITRANVTIDGSTQPGATVNLEARRSKRLGMELLINEGLVNDLGVSI